MGKSSFKDIFKETMKYSAASSLTTMLFGIVVIMCLAIGISGVLAIKKAQRDEEREELWLGLGWTGVVVGFTPLVLLLMPHVLVGFGRMIGYILAVMILEG